MTLKNMFSAMAIAMFISACSTPRTSDEALMKWYPNQKYHQSLETSALEQEALEGSIEAELQFGIRLMNGDRVDQDIEKGAKIFKRLAMLGDARAQFMLGTAYDQGAGVERNPDQALGLFRDSAEQGYDLGQYWYAFMLSRGRGIPEPDWKAALPWFQKAADQGHPLAQFSLGEIHESCRAGLDRNFDLAAYWYRRSFSENPSAAAQYNILRLIDLGLVAWQDGDPGEPQSRIKILDMSKFEPCDPDAYDPLLN